MAPNTQHTVVFRPDCVSAARSAPSVDMADLEDLALKRDRGYLVRLVLMLLLGLGASAFIWNGLTGDRVSGCLANAFMGGGSVEEGTKPAP